MPDDKRDEFERVAQACLDTITIRHLLNASARKRALQQLAVVLRRGFGKKFERLTNMHTIADGATKAWMKRAREDERSKAGWKQIAKDWKGTAFDHKRELVQARKMVEELAQALAADGDPMMDDLIDRADQMLKADWRLVGSDEHVLIGDKDNRAYPSSEEAGDVVSDSNVIPEPQSAPLSKPFKYWYGSKGLTPEGMIYMGTDSGRTRIAELEVELAKARNGLEFYADRKNHYNFEPGTILSIVNREQGHVARETLKEIVVGVDLERPPTPQEIENRTIRPGAGAALVLETSPRIAELEALLACATEALDRLGEMPTLMNEQIEYHKILHRDDHEFIRKAREKLRGCLQRVKGN